MNQFFLFFYAIVAYSHPAHYCAFASRKECCVVTTKGALGKCLLSGVLRDRLSVSS